MLSGMLSINAKVLPASDLLYAAFRLALLDTLERIALAEQLEVSDRPFGYLTQVPFLRDVHPGVQLDQLLLTWSRQMTCEVQTADLLDEAVLYAICESAAQIIRCDRQAAARILKSGPFPCSMVIGSQLADSIQKLHLQYTGEGNFLLLSQFLDIPPEESARLKLEYGIGPEFTDSMFDILARYRVSPLLAERSRGLLTPAEVRELFGVLRNHLPRAAAT